jgi:hypothetical protein
MTTAFGWGPSAPFRIADHRTLSEGKTIRDAVRLLKRYLARHLYRLLEHGPPLAT